MTARLRALNRTLTLTQRFTLASAVILLAGMLGVGLWVQEQIETGVVNRTGATTSLYVDSFVSPYLQEYGHTGELSEAEIERLNHLLRDTPLGRQIVSFKVWDTRGTLLYSSDPSQIGRSFPMNDSMLRARLGDVVTTISPLEDEENAALAAEYEQLLETYSPVWLSGTNQVIAVAEFYQTTDALEQEIAVLQRRSWLVVGLAITLMFVLLSGFVRRASGTIERQKAELARRVDQLTEVLAQNQALHRRVRRAAASISVLNESYLRRIGAELHDGPTQELGLSLLNLDRAIAALEEEPDPDRDGALSTLTEMELMLRRALDELRGIAAGLILPELSELDLAGTVVRAVRAHERRSRSKVDLAVGELPPSAAMPLKTTVYRLIQEALNNAYLHADGIDARVEVRLQEEELVVEIEDHGPGFNPNKLTGSRDHIGLSGMRERAESVGGRFEIESQVGAGTTVRAWLPTDMEQEAAL
jgi:signal transduction histidine kinase